MGEVVTSSDSINDIAEQLLKKLIMIKNFKEENPEFSFVHGLLVFSDISFEEAQEQFQLLTKNNELNQKLANSFRSLQIIWMPTEQSE